MIDIEPAVDAAARAYFFRLNEIDGASAEWEQRADKYRDIVRPNVTVAATVLEIQFRRQVADWLTERAADLSRQAEHVTKTHRNCWRREVRRLESLAAQIRDLDQPLTKTPQVSEPLPEKTPPVVT